MLKGGSILRLHDFKEQGKSFREISRITGHSRNTVRKYVRDGHTGKPAKRAPKGSILDEFKPAINRWMAEGLFNCRVILEKLRKLGYTGGYTIVKDYVQPYRPPKKQKATVRYETKPGEQAQVDWGICEYKNSYGERKKVPVFVMILGHSRAIYVEFTRRCDIHPFLRCLAHALEYFGGVPKVVLTDRMKTVLLGNNPALTFDMIISHTTIVFSRYLILEWERRQNTDERSLGGLFYLYADEVMDIDLKTALRQLMTFVLDILTNKSKNSEASLSQLLNWINELPSYIKALLALSGCES